MKLLIFSDIHQDWQALERVLDKQADLYICLGDFTQAGSGFATAGDLFSQKGEKLWVINGNSESLEDIKRLAETHGVTDFTGQVFKKGRWNLAGLGGCNMTPFNTPGDVKETELEKRLKIFKGLKNLVLFTHVPPKNTKIDYISSGMHVGSSAVREFIDQEQPKYVFSGHVHENAGKKDRIGRTKCFLIGKEGTEFKLP